MHLDLYNGAFISQSIHTSTIEEKNMTDQNTNYPQDKQRLSVTYFSLADPEKINDRIPMFTQFEYEVNIVSSTAALKESLRSSTPAALLVDLDAASQKFLDFSEFLGSHAFGIHSLNKIINKGGAG